MQKLTTVEELLRADDIRGVLADVNTHLGELSTIVIVTREEETGYCRIRFFANSGPEVIGMLELCKLAIESKFNLDIEEGDDG